MATFLPLGPWFVLLSFAAFVVINGAIWLARRHKAATSGSRRAKLTAEIAFLRREAAKLNTPSTYARCAKYQRLANAKDKDLADLNAGPGVSGTADRLLVLGRAVKTLVLCAVTLAVWEAPVARVMPRAVVAPLGRLLAFPHGAELAGFGGVAVAPWLLLLDLATEALARAAFPSAPPGTACGPAALDPAAVERLMKEVDAMGRSRSQQQLAQPATL
ncbi:hypothetical protein VOLCADRAFT_119133 [Volvox carteri f. nagariensis]|uniref:Uncharacterized protein n=1 Tax=Volvox carteri f. nagariensis TaxID=3068 RepID=D8UAK5_VOLCA|nr:uncharacterized protein VOLCADRAFT_119133 [Volvox carteri f. nagariensis]EFJ43340.1 hypothetical protein VOLCADRAFT_119133 [Volvox carteri f. nagariensis]|eukprot:XP_002955700.1 hypothetical protein VOLCADRAFT_119133 [Volvox carteri f. nagariensis]